MVFLIIGLVIALGVVAVWAASEHVKKLAAEALTPEYQESLVDRVMKMYPPEVPPTPPVPEAVAIIDAMGTAMAKVWSPQLPEQHYDIPIGDSPPEDINEYDPFAEHEKQMMAELWGSAVPREGSDEPLD